MGGLAREDPKTRQLNFLAFRRFIQGFDSVILFRKHLSGVVTPIITTIRINPVAQFIVEVCRSVLPRRIVTSPDRKLSNGFFFPCIFELL